ncbi:MAG: C39 family peptidase [bacterium]|nr:C39 family peptidase [bacterium]
MIRLSRKPLVLLILILCLLGGLLFAFFRLSQKLPNKKTIDVPFTTQAPTGNWTGIWENACEETTIYMVSSFYKNDPIKRDAAIAQIKNIIAVKNKDFKISDDESLTTIADLIKTLGLPWNAKLVADPTEIDLKTELSQNHPVIVPVFAPSLWSATFKGDGPDYHVMVLVGYDDTKGEFIVNDPGNTSGHELHFPYATFMNAIHDLNAKDFIAGKKAVLFTEQSDWISWFNSLAESN